MGADLVSGVKSALVGELEELNGSLKQLVEPLSEEEFWAKPVEPGNSVGHLCLHLTGNLSHFVGAQLGGSGYVRNREREFTETQKSSKSEVIDGLDEAVATFRRVVEKLDADRLCAPHPEARFGTVLKTLVHLVSHFALHRGQMSYIVRYFETGSR
jgi:uncharacterized damage-inducible protein DinB